MRHFTSFFDVSGRNKWFFRYFLSLIVITILSTGNTWGQTPVIPKLYLTAQNTPSGTADWTITNAAINNSGTDYWKMINTNAVLISAAMNLNSFTAESCVIKLGTFGTVNAAKQTITVYISTDNGSTWSSSIATRTPTVSSSTAMAAIDLSGYSGTQVRLKFANLGGDASTGVRFYEAYITGTATPTTYSVTYDSNNATSGTPPTDASSPYTSGSTVTVKTNSGSLARTGYSFAGWNTLANGTGTSYAADGNATFTINANTTLYAKWYSTDASLSALTTTAGTLSPTFASATTSYTANVSNTTSSISVTPTVNESHATVKVNGTTTTSGSASAAIALNEGSNAINVEVTAQDGTTKTTYTLTVNRAAASSPTISTGTLSGFGNICTGTTAGPNTFTITGTNLTTDNIVISALSGYSYSTTENGTYTSTLELSQSGGSYSQTIYVKFAPSAAQSYNGNIALSGGGVSGTVNCAATGSGVNTAPTVSTTSPAGNITATTATLSGSITDAGCQPVTAKGFCYGSSSNPDLSGTHTTESGAFESTLTGLSPNTSYHFRAYATSLAGTSYGTDQTFTTSGLNAPTAAPAASVTTSGFTANWGAIDGATEYRLDVSSSNTFSTGVNASDLIISEYCEGSSNNKYIEIYNGTGQSIDLSKYSIKQAVDGTGWSSDISLTLLLTGTLENNQTYVVAASNAGASITSKANILISYSASSQGGKVPFFTGNDAIGLFKNGILIDLFGNPNNSSTINIAGSAYGDNHTIVRKSSILAGNTDWTSSAGTNSTNSEWTVYANDVFTYLGAHTMNTTYIQSYVTGYNNLSVSGTSQAVTGLSANTAYYYRVRAVGGNSTSSNSNTTTAITGLTTSTNTSALPDCPTCDIVVSTNGSLTANNSKTFGSITAAPGANITINSGATLTAPVTLQSDINKTATLVDNNNSTIAATVQQYLSGKTGTNSRGWWYVSSPVSNATAAVFIPNGSNKFGYWDETSFTYPQITDNSTTLNKGQGYVFYNSGDDLTVNFSGTLNTGDVTIYPTRTGTTNGSRGFNLVGNPYPSYLDWNGVAKTHVRNTIWYRTSSGSAMAFDTYDNSTGTPVKTAVGTYGQVSNYIPPMQAFWVKADADNLATNEASLVFHNSDRSHQDQSSTSNHLRVPSETGSPAILRLRVSNGVNRDETIIASYTGALDGPDNFDSPKMAVNNVEVPEIFTLAGDEEVVINYMNSLAADKELPLGFRPGKEGDFSLQATELTNLDSNLKVVLKDNGNEYDLTNGESYSFSSDATPTNSRFSIAFRASGTVTNLPENSLQMANIYCNKDKQLVIVLPKNIAKGNAQLLNVLGQEIKSIQLSETCTTEQMNEGIYLIRVTANGNSLTRKVIVK